MTRLGLLFLLIFTLSAQAQEKTASDTSSNTTSATSVWFTAGPGFSSLEGDNSEVVTSARTGLSLGLEGEVPLTHMMSIQAGIDYLQKGENIDVATPNVSGALVANYFEIPVLARVNLPERMNKVSFLAGPYAALAVARTINLTNSSSAVSTSSSTDASSSIKRLDIGLRFGIAYEIPLTDMCTATFGLDYDLGLTNINHSASTDSIHNRSLIVALGLGHSF